MSFPLSTTKRILLFVTAVYWMETPWTLMAMSALFCLAILVMCYHHYVRFSHYGICRVNAVDYRNKPDMLNPYWIMLGQFVNMMVWVLVLWGSFDLMYLIVGATEIVIHAMASFSFWRLPRCSPMPAITAN